MKYVSNRDAKISKGSSIGQDCSRWSAPDFLTRLKDQTSSFRARDVMAQVMFRMLFCFVASDFLTKKCL